MDALTIQSRLLMTLVALVFAAPAAAQTGNELRLFETVEGSIAENAESWRFNASTSQIVSFIVESTSGDLDPILTIRDDAGQEIIRNDDYNYPDTGDALLEAISIPQLGAYTATVAAYGDTSGDYTLTMLPGYAHLAYDEPFDTAGDWEAVEGTATAVPDDETLRLALAAGSDRGLAFTPSLDSLTDFYAQVDVSGITGASWVVGMAVRGQDDGSAYLFLVNDRAEWRFAERSDGGERAITGWVRHPNIRTGETAFTLGVLAVGSGFDLFYNNNIVAHVVATALDESGQAGLVVGSTRATEGIAARFDNFAITTPLEVEGEALIPQQLMLGSANAAVQELRRRRLISSSGQLVLNVAESFVQYARPGVNSVPLASSITFTNLAMGTTVYPDSVSGPPSGCGIILRATDTRNYILAYIDGQGGYGISERTEDSFSAGAYAEAETWAATEGHQLLVIASGDTLLYYVDGRYVGTIESDAEAGGIANAVVNFEAVDTSCQFVNTWVWRWN